MVLRYNIDLNDLSVLDYKELLKKQNLLPGRKILLQDIDEKFALLNNHGIMNISNLKKCLSTPLKISVFAAGTGISENYLIVLKREIGSLMQKPVLIESFPDINASLILTLKDSKIKTSKDYFENGPSKSDELLCLCDLVRINGVGVCAAKAFYDAGYRSVTDVAYADATDMLDRVSNVNKAKEYYKAKLGVKDMQFCIDFALLIIKLCI